LASLERVDLSSELQQRVADDKDEVEHDRDVFVHVGQVVLGDILDRLSRRQRAQLRMALNRRAKVIADLFFD
jgi:hypothetical protein